MDYYDMDQHIDEMPDYDINEPSAMDMFATCAWPSIQQIFKYFWPFVLCNIAFRLTTQTFSIPHNLQHISSIVCGLTLSYFTYDGDVLYNLGFVSIQYFALLVIRFANLKRYGIIFTILCLTTLILGEMLDSSSLTWHRLRGTQMIAAMKVISIGFDLDRKKIKHFPNFFEFWGYLLCPGNVIMGPWSAYNDYLYIFNDPKFSYIWILQVFANGFIAIFFLLTSNCFIETFLPNLSSAWAAAYKGAMSFRCSHYFICFLSHCTMIMSGLGAPRNLKHKSILGYTITRPWIIELPRSLVDVVVYWNLSMHYWLKTYVFLQLKPHGIFKAIILTYIISSLLHGVNVQLSAVLLTLGFATYAEYTVRKKVADIFDACVLETCSHRYDYRNPLVLAFNFAFRILAMVHLAYLGIVLDGFIEKPDISLSFQIVQERWANLDYLSHWIIVCKIIFNAII